MVRQPPVITVGSGPVQAVSLTIAAVAVVALVAVLVLLAKKRADVNRANALLALSRELKRRGFTFVGPVSMYALMEAIGVLEHRR